MIGRCVDLRRLAAIGSPLIAAALCTAALALAQESLTAENAWVPWAPPVLKVHVAYMTIFNRSAADRHIVAADSPDYERIELHRSTVKDGVSTMQTVEEVRVPANGRVEFAPAGLHVMLV